MIDLILYLIYIIDLIYLVWLLVYLLLNPALVLAAILFWRQIIRLRL